MIRAVSILVVFLLSSMCRADQTNSAAAAPESGVTIRSNVQEVVLDMVVRDSRGRVVKNLQQRDVQVLEDGVPQQIRSFEFIPGREPGRRQPAAAQQATASAAPAAVTAENPLKAMNLL